MGVWHSNDAILQRLEQIQQEQQRIHQVIQQEQQRIQQEQQEARRQQDKVNNKILHLLSGTYEVVLRDFNAYDEMTEASLKGEKCKDIFMDTFQLNTGDVRCELTGKQGKCKLGHIVPRGARKHVRQCLHLRTFEMDSVRNLVMLSTNIEMAFDRLQISFVPRDVLHDDLVLKIWDDDARDVPIFDTAREKIGDFENLPFQFDILRKADVDQYPFRRCFAYQALVAYLKNTDATDAQSPSLERLSNEFNSQDYKNTRDVMLRMHSDFRRQVQQEVSREREDEEDSEV